MTLETEPDRPQVWGDMTAVRRVLTNLVDNALKYSPPGAPVTVVMRELETEAQIEVSDRGKGIPPEHLETIFERFRQAEPAFTRSAGGVGLGLFIVKKLVDAHGGSIDVESETRVGTRFRVHLPKRAGDRGRIGP
jgi:signal transduction histidine kinase